uniref:Peptidase M12B domain-containing protein n=1 Tax=Romanomermis culicivorax TaxID=13658 RepID=A0A915IJ45_ROMCU
MGNKISGLTRVGGVCEAENACTVLEGFDFSAALVGAHEIAHALGVNHDEPNCDSTHIMAQSLGPGRIGWSSCSIRELQTEMSKLDDDGRNCLRETSSHKPALDLDGLPLPGIQFNANDQCALVFSPNHRQRPVPREASDNICHMMFCGLGFIGPIISSNPALEGTICGQDKYCQYGQCIQFPTGINGYPVSINGQWSSWSSIDCAQCSCGPVLGSIGVMASSRACSDPIPSDGGRTCYGSKIRASICKEFCPFAKFTSKSYVKRVCLERKRRSFDYALLGTGIRLVNSPCKILRHIWFHSGYSLRDTDEHNLHIYIEQSCLRNEILICFRGTLDYK